MAKRPPDILPCPQCNAEGQVYLSGAKRYMLYCVACGYDGYLKEAARHYSHAKS